MPQPILVDVDTGVDDAIALAVLGRLAPELVAVTTVAGNVPIDWSTPNTLRVLDWLGFDQVPVHRGASRPLAVPYLDAAHVHGENGLGNAQLPASTRGEARGDAVKTILELAERHAGELTILTLGPLTNLAIALSLRPRLPEQIGRVVTMGGAFLTAGNVTSHAEFNIYADPHAAQQVFAAPWREHLVLGLDVTHQTILSRRTWSGIPVQGAPPPPELARLILQRTFDERGLDGMYLHDPLAALCTVDPGFVGVEPGSVAVVVDGEQRGRTTFRAGEGTTLVATTVRAAAAGQAICAALEIIWQAHDDARDHAE